MTDSVSSGGQKARIEHERQLYETRKHAADIERQSEKSIEKQQQRNVINAGYGGDNTVSFLTGDGDIEGTTGQISPVLDTPEHAAANGSRLDDMGSMASSIRSDQTAGSILSVRAGLKDNQNLSPESLEDLQRRLGIKAVALIKADDVPPNVIGRIENQIAQLEQMLSGATVDPAALDSLLMTIDTEFANNSLELKGSFQKHTHQKLEVLRTLRPLLNHMVDDASNGFMGKEWKGDGLQKMLDQYGIDIELTQEQLQTFTAMVNQIDDNKGAYAGKSNKEQREIFMKETIALLSRELWTLIWISIWMPFPKR